MKNGRRMKWMLFSALLIVCGLASAAIEIPKASAKALGLTRGKPFSKGLVFVDGRYLEPPYVVERWGVGIRINGVPVVGQVVDWTEFIKTQEGVKITKTETAPAAVPEAESEPEVEDEADDIDTSLDDLFDDDPKPKKAAKKTAKKVRKPKPAKPTTTVSISLEGEFVPNDASKALLAKINKTRTEINTTLLAGGFICFGEKYSRVSGDARIASQILDKLPDIEKSARSEADVVAAVRSASLYYLTEPICRDLYRNRLDYLKLQVRRTKEKKEKAFQKLLDGIEENSRF